MGKTSRGETVYLALGSNLGDRRAFLLGAARGLARAGVHLQAFSALYETDAVADEPQPAYLNAVIRGETDLAPLALLRAALDVEASLGRQRPAGRRRAPRTLDIDVLLHGGTTLDLPELRLPHPELLARPFVRIPLADVARPGLVHPVSGERLDAAPAAPGVRLFESAPLLADLS